MFKSIVIILATAITIIYGSAVESAQPLSISISRPLTGFMAQVMGSGRYVYLDGEIDGQAAKRLEQFLIANGVGNTSTVVLNSPGGSLLGGIELGKVIRKYGMASDVGRRVFRDGRDGYDPAQCMSACTMAFIGGRFRYLTKGSRYGVHRFYFEKAGGGDADIAQVISAAVVNHIKEMDVDVGLFTLTTKAGRDDMLEPPRETLESLHVINNGFSKTAWTIEARSNLIYLKGERDTVFGINKFIVHCGKGNAVLHIIFDPQGRTDEVMSFNAHSLVVDGKDEPIKPSGRQITNEWYNALYSLSPRQVRHLANASSVGMMVRGNFESPMFLGFNSMPVESGAERVRTFLNGCLKG